MYLQGADSKVVFGAGEGLRPATLSATCDSPASKPAAKWVDSSLISSGKARVFLQDVPYHCTNSRTQEPCASTHPSYPRLFTCSWSAPDGSNVFYTTPELAAEAKEVKPETTVLAIEVFLECPVPPAASLAGLPDAPTLRLSVNHSYHGLLQWEGLLDANLVKIQGEAGPIGGTSVMGSAGVSGHGCHFKPTSETFMGQTVYNMSVATSDATCYQNRPAGCSGCSCGCCNNWGFRVSGIEGSIPSDSRYLALSFYAKKLTKLSSLSWRSATWNAYCVVALSDGSTKNVYLTKRDHNTAGSKTFPMDFSWTDDSYMGEWVFTFGSAYLYSGVQTPVTSVRTCYHWTDQASETSSSQLAGIKLEALPANQIPIPAGFEPDKWSAADDDGRNLKMWGARNMEVMVSASRVAPPTQ